MFAEMMKNEISETRKIWNTYIRQNGAVSMKQAEETIRGK